jgi:hypothetical protein
MGTNNVNTYIAKNKKDIKFNLFLYIILFLLSIHFCSSSVDWAIFPSVGNDTLINPTYYNSTTLDGGFIYIPLKIIEAVTGGGGGEKKASTLYYDLEILTDKKRYQAYESVNLTVIIINKGYVPDRDGILNIYMQDTTGKYIINISKVFELVPPTCDQGRYNKYTDKCEQYNGSIIDSLKWVKTYELTFPINSSLGRYPIEARYHSSIQPEIIAKDYVDVYAPIKNLWVIVLIIIIILFAWKYKKSKGGNTYG